MALRDWTNFDFLCWRLSEQPRRFAVLVRHFFIRFFQNDVFPFEDQMKEKLYVVLAMLAPLGWLLTTTLFGRTSSTLTTANPGFRNASSCPFSWS